MGGLGEARGLCSAHSFQRMVILPFATRCTRNTRFSDVIACGQPLGAGLVAQSRKPRPWKATVKRARFITRLKAWRQLPSYREPCILLVHFRGA